MAKRRDKAGIIVRKTPRGLSPVHGFDAERIVTFPQGQEFDLVPRSRRSLPQQRTYWRALKLVCDATGKWPTPEHLHRELKLACGYYAKIVGWDGKVYLVEDSTSFASMSQDEFQAYFDLAMPKLAERIGFDPLAFLAEAA